MTISVHAITDAYKTPGEFCYIWPHIQGDSYRPSESERKDGAKDLVTLFDLLKTAHNFDCREVSEAFSPELVETGIAMSLGQGLNLPFPVCVFDFGITPRNVVQEDGTCKQEGNIHICLLCTEDETRISIRSFFKSSQRNVWAICPVTVTLKKHAETDDIVHVSTTMLPGTLNTHGQSAKSHGYMALAVLALLETRHVEIDEIASPKFINKKRIEKGRSAIPKHSIIKIDYKSAESRDGLSGVHASPHLHWRRGHERTLASGKKTWVKACLVGDPTKGFAKHDYSFSRAPSRLSH